MTNHLSGAVELQSFSWLQSQFVERKQMRMELMFLVTSLIFLVFVLTDVLFPFVFPEWMCFIFIFKIVFCLL